MRDEPTVTDPVEELVARYLVGREAGEHQSLGMVCAARPDLRNEVAYAIARSLAMDAQLQGGEHPPPPPPAGIPGRIALIDQVGRGGMGQVFRALDAEADREVAYKVLLPDLDWPLFRTYFQTEAELTAALEHPAIVRVYAVAPDRCGRPAYSMEFIAGETLHHHLNLPARSGREDPSARLREHLVHFVTVCEAVQYAHARGVTHGDIKAANVRVRADGKAFVMDWGLARRHAGGIPAEALDTDREKLADLLDHVLTGTNPPPALDATRRAALVGRYQTAGELGAVVRGWLDTGGTRDYRDWWSVRVVRWANRHQATATALAAGVLLAFLLTLAVGWYALDRAERRRQDDLAEQKRQSDARERDERVQEAVAAVNSAAGEWRLPAAAAGLERATGALGSDPPDDLRRLVADAAAAVRLAVELDDIRQELSVRRTDPQLPDDGVTMRYAQAFASAGIDPTAADAADRITASPVRAALVAALDDWASSRYTAAPEAGVPVTRLLELARAVDPDPEWRDEFRDPAVRADRKKLSALAARAPLDKLTVAQTTALVSALPTADPSVPRLLAAAEAKRPNDFGLALLGAAWRLQALRVGVSSPAEMQDALAYARTASTLRPDSLAALALLAELYELFNQPAGLEEVARRVAALGRDSWMADKTAAIAARKRGEFKQSLALFERASAAAGDSPTRRMEVAEALMFMGEFAKALTVIETVIERNPTAVNPRAFRAILWAVTGKLADAEREARAVLADDPANEGARVALTVCAIGQGRLAAAGKMARTLVVTNDTSLGLEQLGIYDQLARGNYADILSLVERSDQRERYASMAFFRYLALVGTGRFQNAKAVLDEAEKLQKGGAAPIAQYVNMNGLVFGMMRSTLGNVANIEDKIDSGVAEGLLTRDKFKAAKGVERLALMHIADVLLAKRWTWASVQAYREFLSADTPTSGYMASQPSQLLVVGSYRFHAMRAAAQASVGGGKDAFRTTDKDRAECRADALGWLKEEVAACKGYADRKPSGLSFGKILWGGGNPTAANFNLHLLKSHADLEPIRNKTIVAAMPEAERKLAEELWAEVDKLYDRLNPPLDIPELPDK